MRPKSHQDEAGLGLMNSCFQTKGIPELLELEMNVFSTCGIFKFGETHKFGQEPAVLHDFASCIL